MLSASVGRDSCQRISPDSSNANSVNFRNKAEGERQKLKTEMLKLEPASNL
jgi:hypothetical protein